MARNENCIICTKRKRTIDLKDQRAPRTSSLMLLNWQCLVKKIRIVCYNMYKKKYTSTSYNNDVSFSYQDIVKCDEERDSKTLLEHQTATFDDLVQLTSDLHIH